MKWYDRVRGSHREIAASDVVIVDGEVVKSRWTKTSEVEQLIDDGLVLLDGNRLVLTINGLRALAGRYAQVPHD